VAAGGDRVEAGLRGGGIVGASDALVFAQVDGENRTGVVQGGSRGRQGKLLGVFVVLGDRDTFQAITDPPDLHGFFRNLIDGGMVGQGMRGG
jgi:hypothetical protein